MLFVAQRENVGPLEGLWEVAEDVVDEYDGGFSCCGSNGI